MAALSLPEHVKVDNTLGAALVGFAASCVIYGLLSAQVYTYYRRYPCDRNIYKIIVAIMWTLETVDQCFIGHVVYYYTITNYLNPLVLIADKPVWTLVLQTSLGAVVGTLVKTAFAVRVWTFSNHNFLVTGIVLFVTFSQLGKGHMTFAPWISFIWSLVVSFYIYLALATLYTVKGFQLRLLLDFPSLNIVASLSLGAGVVTDIIIAAALCYYLQKLRTGFTRSDSIVKSLMLYAVNTGILTSACSLVTLTTYNILPRTLIFLPFYFVLSKLYVVSFLATLNTRAIVRGRGTDSDQENPTHRNTFLMHAKSTASRIQGNGVTKSLNNVSIKVQTDVQQQISAASEVVELFPLSTDIKT